MNNKNVLLLPSFLISIVVPTRITFYKHCGSYSDNVLSPQNQRCSYIGSIRVFIQLHNHVHKTHIQIKICIQRVRTRMT